MAIRPLKTTIVRRTSGLALLAAGILIASVLAAPAGATSETRTIGPFDVTFYGDWTTQQKDDFAPAVAAWDSHILNTQGRQIVIHAFWDNLGGNTLGETYGPTNGNGATS